MNKLFIYISIFFFTIHLNAKNLIFLNVAVPYKIKASNRSQVWVQNKNIIQIKDYGKYFVFTGKTKGTSKVQIGDILYTFTVGSKEEKESYTRLKSVLRFSPNLELDYEKEKFIITGSIHEISEWKTLRGLNLDNWILNADVSKAILQESQKLLNAELAEYQSASMEIYATPFPSISVSKSFIQSSTRALEIIKMYGLNLILNNEIIMVQPIIKVKMNLLEIRKSSLTKIGINPPNQFTAQISSLSKLSEGAWTSDVNLHLLESKGIGQILASPVLLTKSGSEAEFLAGGEIPIKISNNKTKDIIWKKYGLNLKVTPTVDSQGHIKMDIETEISSIDPIRTVDGIPAFLTNKIQSHFELQKSQTIILSGLVKHLSGEAIVGWPWLSKIPILGALFSSVDFQQEKTELIILVTPEIGNN